jgi:two-component system response regulator FixJ
MLLHEIRKVYLVDNDVAARRAMAERLIKARLDVRPFYEDDFLDNISYLDPGCAVVDILREGIPNFSSLDATHQSEILPSIAMCENCTVSLAVSAIQHGAVDVYDKKSPFSELSDMVSRALAKLPDAIDKENSRRRAISSLLRLSPREFQVLVLVSQGHLSKTIAFELGVSTRTVEMHRQSVLKRLDVERMADAVLMFQSVSGDPEIVARSLDAFGGETKSSPEFSH